MSSVIPKNIYRTIEYRLHTYNEMKLRIEDWQASVYSTQNTQETIKGKGRTSDPTARIVINLLNPPKNIKEDMQWAEIIEEAKKFCESKGRSKLFDVWYGCNPTSKTLAAMKIPAHINTLDSWRDDIVYFIAFRASQKNLVHFN